VIFKVIIFFISKEVINYLLFRIFYEDEDLGIYLLFGIFYEDEALGIEHWIFKIHDSFSLR